MTQLLLARSMHLLHLVDDLLPPRPIGERLQDRGHAQRWIGGKVRHPAIELAHQYDADHSTDWFVGRQERLVLLDHAPAVEREEVGLPAAGLCSTLGQIDG